jgi:hypothetical protein
MAINGIVTAREAKVVAGELDRITTNTTMLLLMVSMDPEMRPQTGLAANFLKGLAQFSEDLKKASKGLEDTDEVFATTEMDMKEVEGLAALEKLFGDLPK